jgi:hypothetical protein
MAKTLLVVGNPVVVAGDGSRHQLAGTLTAKQREALGEAKVESLLRSGHLQTEEQVKEDERLKAELDERRRNAQFGHGINPNYGTPSMTPEAAAKNDAPALAEGQRPDESKLGDTGQGGNPPADNAWEKTPVGALGLEPAIVKALTDAKLATAGDVIAYGDEHDGLTDLEGIGEAREDQIKAALTKAKHAK